MATVEKCHRCGAVMIPAGISNQIDGRCYHGLKELADKDWIVCPCFYSQDIQTGDWHGNQ